MGERPAMGSQPNLASRSEVVLIYKYPQKFRGPSPTFGAQKKNKILDHFPRLLHSTLHMSGTKRRMDKQKL